LAGSWWPASPDFAEEYAAHALEKAQASGATAERLAAQREQMQRFKELYRNPVVNSAITFLEPLPVGVLMTLVFRGDPAAETLVKRRGRCATSRCMITPLGWRRPPRAATLHGSHTCTQGN
jgi:hypothetical protein